MCASEAPSFRWISEWMIDCGWTTTSMLRVGDAEEVVGLDQLEALVEERRRVDRDPPAHLPGGVRERLVDRDLREVLALAERPARGGEDELFDRARRLLGVDELEERRVLGVDRDDLRLGRFGQGRDQLAADDQALLVREGEVDALAQRDDRRPQAGRAGDRVQDEVGLGRRDELAHALGPGEDARALGRAPLRDGRVGDRDALHAVLVGLGDRVFPARLSRDADQLKVLPRGLDHLERLHADRAGGAEHDHTLHGWKGTSRQYRNSTER